MSMEPVAAEARTSCERCHRRKKKCDRTLPQCQNCRAADISCSFLNDDCQSGTYPIAFVKGLEARIRELEQRLASVETQASSTQGAFAHYTVSLEESHHDVDAGGVPVPESDRRASRITLARELRILSEEATAERHLGASSGLSFANLTQMILKRLTPDRTEFVFRNHQAEEAVSRMDWTSPEDLSNPAMLDIPSLVGFGSHSLGTMPLSSIIEPAESLAFVRFPEKSRAEQLVSFYFAHSHSLYPVLDRTEFLALLDRVYDSMFDQLSLDPVSSFRLWIVLAIGQSSRCSILMAEESEALLYYNKALEFFERALDYGDMVALETIVLQVSFSFFNQVGPNTWFLVGMAARMAIGLGMHTPAAYKDLPFNVANLRKRIFYSIYMMDRVVSMALGRPFALQDDDIEITPFVEADDENIDVHGVRIQQTLETPMMAVALHILKLRSIASKISVQVYGNAKTIRENQRRRDEIIFTLHKELIEWRRGMPFPLPDVHPRVPHLSAHWYDFNYHTHLALLYRPSPLFPTLEPAQVVKLADAASMSIRQAHTMHQQKRFAYNWLNLYALFTSTLSLVYATTVQPEELVVYLKRSQVVNDLEIALRLFDQSNTKFPGAKNVQVIIDRVIQHYKSIIS